MSLLLASKWFRPRAMVVVMVGVVAAVLVDATVGDGAEPSLLISADGILDEQLMPITYLILDGRGSADGAGELESRAESRTTVDAFHRTVLANESAGTLGSGDASYASAISMLGFHRTMINLYRCKGFLAKQILDTVPAVQPGSLSKRMSAPASVANFSSAAAMLLSTPRTAPDTMLYDPGSSGYREWLTKTTTLDDIYENFLSAGKASGPAAGNRSVPPEPAHVRPTSSARLGQEEYFDEGIITGYAVQPDPLPMGGAERNLRGAGPGAAYYDYAQRPGKLHRELLEGEAIAGGQEAARGDFAYRRHYQHHHHHPVLEYEEKWLEKGSLGLKDLFDIALTTLAYLSFGMFILQVIMCITMTKADSGMMILPTTPDVEVEEDDGRRFARALPDPTPPHGTVREQNRLAAHVLGSMDVLLDGGPHRDVCLRAALCEANRFSRTVTTIHGYWISVWSFGVSWLSRCRTPACSSPAFALQCLSATLVGLGNGNCAELYPCPGRPAAGGRIK